MSRRTIFRDLDVLRQSGVPLLFDDEQQRYRIPQDYFLPPINFTPEEALAQSRKPPFGLSGDMPTLAVGMPVAA